MKISEKYNYELIHDYIDGLLDAETSARIQNLLIEDEVARSIAKGIITLKNNFDEKETEAYLERVYRVHLKAINEHSKPRKTYAYWKIAAAVLILATSSLLVLRTSSTSIDDILENELASKYMISQNLRSEESELTRGLLAYTNGSYTTAISLLDHDDSALGLITKGLSQLYNGEYAPASETLQHETLQKSRYAEQSRWFLALAYIQSREQTKAIYTLTKIVNTKDHYKAVEAQNLLELLSD